MSRAILRQLMGISEHVQTVPQFIHQVACAPAEPRRKLDDAPEADRLCKAGAVDVELAGTNRRRKQQGSGDHAK